jgi:hypothetical protein
MTIAIITTNNKSNPGAPISIQTKIIANIKVVGAPTIVGKLVMQLVIVATSMNQYAKN